jgi:OOP family OmpA-OmpF porin
MKYLQLTATVILALLVFTASAQNYKIDHNEVIPDAPVTFKTGTAEMLPQSDAALLIIKKYLEDKTAITLLRVEAHTENTGNAESNQLLSQKRAAAVCQRLVALGVDCMRLLPVGFGDSKPLTDNSTAAGKTQNRRIVFFNATLRGRAIGGMPVDGGGKTADNPCY